MWALAFSGPMSLAMFQDARLPGLASVRWRSFTAGTYIVREWDLWYFIAPRMSIGGGVMWYDASNLTTAVQKNLGVNKNGRVGGGGSWFDGSINYRYQF